MNRLFWTLLILAPILGVASATMYLLQEAPPTEVAAVEPDPKPEPKPAPAASTDVAIAPAPRAVGSETPIAMQFAVKPKELSPAVKMGLEFLVKSQQDDGGWNQGGGWRTNNAGGGRIEGANVEDPSDIGNTCIALLALVRAGNTPTGGEYKDAVKKGLAFVMARIAKADSDSLYVTDVRNTQLQSKIGPYVDTFLANLLLAELKGKSGEQDRALVAALDKTMKKIVKHQGADGNFANNGGWAPVLSVSIANKGIARARQNGYQVDTVVLERAFAQSNASVMPAGSSPAKPDAGFFASLPSKMAPAEFGARFAYSSDGLRVTGAGFGGGFAGGFGGGGLGGSGMPGDAGVSLYRVGQGGGNSQDVVNSLRADLPKIQQVLKDQKATRAEKEEATKKVEQLRSAVQQNKKVQESLAANVNSEAFVAGFGSNGGEEFLSFLNISETLLIKGGKDWADWDARMTKGLEKAQDKNGSWQGHHCITGRTFCTAGALLVLLADRTPFPPEALVKADVKPEK